MTNKKNYHYTECGLDNVVLVNMPVDMDDSGEEMVSIPNIKGLHKVLACRLLKQTWALRGKEIRFLRTEMGMTQSQLAEILRKDTQSIGRWERAEISVDQIADILIRKLVTEKLGLDLNVPLEELSKWTVPASASPPISIDGSNPDSYKPVAA